MDSNVFAKSTNDNASVGGVVSNDNSVDDEITQKIENMSEDDILDLFIEQLIEDKNFQNLTDELHAQIKQDLKERLTFQINQAMIAALPEEDLTELNASLDREDANIDMVNDLIEKNGIDTGKIAEETMVEFREAYLSDNVE